MQDASASVKAEVRTEAEGSPLVATVAFLGLAIWLSILGVRLARRMLATSQPHGYAKARTGADAADEMNGPLPDIPSGRVEVFSRTLDDVERYRGRGGGRRMDPPVLALRAPVVDDYRDYRYDDYGDHGDYGDYGG